MTRAVTRRQCLTGILAAPAIMLGMPRVSDAASLPRLPSLAASEARLLLPADRAFEAYEPAFNRRTMLRPQLRALCKTPSSVAVMIDWARSNGLAFALRSGGHGYEGFSQSPGVVIDTRLLNGIELDAANRSVTVGSGAALGAIYKTLGAEGLAIPAGSCPTVGVAGHVLGGGYGLLARPLGLACDSLQSVELVDPQGNLVEADRAQHADLFWACCGGGGGSFGAATRFRFDAHPVGRVVVFGISWALSAARAARLMKAWQAWAPQAPNAITSIFRMGKRSDGAIDVRCAGQSVGSESQLREELKILLGAERPSAAPLIRPMSFLAAVDHFSGGWQFESIYSKAKSDYVLEPMSDDGMMTLMHQLQGLPAGAVAVICDAYGGAVADQAADASAFARRAGTRYCIQYYSSWQSAKDTPSRLARMRSLYASMRPYVSGAAYVNYCDLDLADWPDAYWGQNLARLKAIKAAFDPQNVFRHAQSIPPA